MVIGEWLVSHICDLKTYYNFVVMKGLLLNHCSIDIHTHTAIQDSMWWGDGCVCCRHHSFQFSLYIRHINRCKLLFIRHINRFAVLVHVQRSIAPGDQCSFIAQIPSHHVPNTHASGVANDQSLFCPMALLYN
eukprot:571557_1